MTIDLYYLLGSAPCRVALLAAKAAGVELNHKVVELSKQEQLSEEFLKINPQHCIPTLVDNGFVLWESRAIATYLIDKYAKDDSLYPKDVKQRALVDQRLYFDMGTLYQRFADYYFPVIFAGASYDPEKLPPIEEAFKLLNGFLEGQDFLAGKHLTVADLSTVATVATCDVMNFDISKYPNVAKWYEKVQEIAPGYEEINGKGTQLFKQMADFVLKNKISYT